MKWCYVALVLGLVSCKSKPADTPDEPISEIVTAPRAYDQSTPLQKAMKDHWGLATWIRDAVVAGDFDEIPQAAGQLADETPAEAVPDWTPHIEAMQDHAKQAEKADNLADAAAATAEMARTCGQCHYEMGAVLAFDDTIPFAEGPTTRTHMQRHAWGTRALWNGLVGPSDEQWALGADSFATEPLHESEFVSGWTVTPAIEKAGINAHDLGIMARDAESAKDRARIFGELLTTCANCHQQLSPQ